MANGEGRLSGALIHAVERFWGIELACASLGKGGRGARGKVPFANGHRPVELTHFCMHSTVKTVKP